MCLLNTVYAMLWTKYVSFEIQNLESHPTGQLQKMKRVASSDRFDENTITILTKTGGKLKEKIKEFGIEFQFDRLGQQNLKACLNFKLKGGRDWKAFWKVNGHWPVKQAACYKRQTLW